MTRQLADIQTGIRYKGRNDSIDLTDAGILAITNDIYRKIASLFELPEFRKSKELSAVTVADQAAYTWDSNLPNFIDLKAVEISTPGWRTAVFGTIIFGVDSFTSSSTANTWKLIYPPPSEFEWNLAGQKSSQRVPDYYVRYYDLSGSANKIEFRPAPSTAGDSLRATGIVEPAALTGLSSYTEILLEECNDALEYLVAYQIMFHDMGGNDPYVQAALSSGIQLLNAITGKDIKPDEFFGVRNNA